MAGHDYLERSEVPLGQDWTVNYDGTIDETGTVVAGAVNEVADMLQIQASVGYYDLFPSWVMRKSLCKTKPLPPFRRFGELGKTIRKETMSIALAVGLTPTSVFFDLFSIDPALGWPKLIDLHITDSDAAESDTISNKNPSIQCERCPDVLRGECKM